jgi:RHS repeat-associated protein
LWGIPKSILRPLDASGSWKWDNAEPFGNNQPNENPSGLGNFEYSGRRSGEYYDKETGKIHNGYRSLDTGIGRYIQSDPIGLLGGVNTYGHVGGNPLKFTDPLGLVPPGGEGDWSWPDIPRKKQEQPCPAKEPEPNYGYCLGEVGPLGPLPGPLGLSVAGNALTMTRSIVASGAVLYLSYALWGLGPVGTTMSFSYAPLVCNSRFSGPLPEVSPFAFGP